MQEIIDAFNSDSNTISTFGLLLQLFLGTILLWILGRLYVFYGKSLSNRAQLSSVLILVGLTTLVIITVVKSSLALSLGLVGALSIIRFRTAIKEPEELAFFFIAISIGLGLGANQIMVTLVGFVVLSLIIYVSGKRSNNKTIQNLIIDISKSESSTEKNEQILNEITNILISACDQVNLKRFSDSNDRCELSFVINVNHFELLSKIKNEIQKDFPSARITYLENI